MVPSFFHNCEFFWSNLPWSESDLHLYTCWSNMCLPTFSFNDFLGLKDFLSDITGGAFNENLSRLSCGSLANFMWYGNLLWLKQGSTFMAAQKVSIATPVSSFSTFSGMLDILRLSRRSCCSIWSSLTFCSMIVLFKALSSLSLISSSSFNGFVYVFHMR